MGLLLSCSNNEAAKAASAAPPETAVVKASTPTNKDIYEMLNTGDFSRLDSIMDKNAIDHQPGGTVIGLDSIKASLIAAKKSFPDMKIEVLDEVVQGDIIFTRVHTTGTNTGPMDGMPPTGKKIDMTGVDYTHLKNGKLYEHWDYSDNITFFKQLGIDPLAPVMSKKK